MMSVAVDSQKSFATHLFFDMMHSKLFRKFELFVSKRGKHLNVQTNVSEIIKRNAIQLEHFSNLHHLIYI